MIFYYILISIFLILCTSSPLREPSSYPLLQQHFNDYAPQEHKRNALADEFECESIKCAAAKPGGADYERAASPSTLLSPIHFRISFLVFDNFKSPGWMAQTCEQMRDIFKLAQMFYTCEYVDLKAPSDLRNVGVNSANDDIFFAAAAEQAKSYYNMQIKVLIAKPELRGKSWAAKPTSQRHTWGLIFYDADMPYGTLIHEIAHSIGGLLHIFNPDHCQGSASLQACREAPGGASWSKGDLIGDTPAAPLMEYYSKSGSCSTNDWIWNHLNQPVPCVADNDAAGCVAAGGKCLSHPSIGPCATCSAIWPGHQPWNIMSYAKHNCGLDEAGREPWTRGQIARMHCVYDLLFKSSWSVPLSRASSSSSPSPSIPLPNSVVKVQPSTKISIEGVDDEQSLVQGATYVVQCGACSGRPVVGVFLVPLASTATSLAAYKLSAVPRGSGRWQVRMYEYYKDLSEGIGGGVITKGEYLLVIEDADGHQTRSSSTITVLPALCGAKEKDEEVTLAGVCRSRRECEQDVAYASSFVASAECPSALLGDEFGCCTPKRTDVTNFPPVADDDESPQSSPSSSQLPNVFVRGIPFIGALVELSIRLPDGSSWLHTSTRVQEIKLVNVERVGVSSLVPQADLNGAEYDDANEVHRVTTRLPPSFVAGNYRLEYKGAFNILFWHTNEETNTFTSAAFGIYHAPCKVVRSSSSSSAAVVGGTCRANVVDTRSCRLATYNADGSDILQTQPQTSACLPLHSTLQCCTADSAAVVGAYKEDGGGDGDDDDVDERSSLQRFLDDYWWLVLVLSIAILCIVMLTCAIVFIVSVAKRRRRAAAATNRGASLSSSLHLSSSIAAPQSRHHSSRSIRRSMPSRSSLHRSRHLN